MKLRTTIGIITATAALAVITGCAANKEAGGENDEAVSLSAVPAAVKQTLKDYATDAEVKTVALADQDGTKVYEFDLEQGARKSELTIAPDGKFMGTEEDVAFATLPAPAQAALTAQAGNGKLVSFEKAVDEKHQVLYEGVIDKGGKKTEVAVDANGKVVSTEAVTPGKD